MYAQFFGLQQEPFSIAPDPRYLFMSERHREALAHLLYGLNSGGGFVLLTGEIGAGKTTVCRAFLEQIPRRCNVAYIFNPKLTVAELLKTVCDEYRIPYQHEGEGSTTVKEYLDPLNQFLLKTHAVGQNNVLIIDEAQNLPLDVLEQLRLLTNLETNERKLLQIILIGQPELREMLARPDMEQLAQRVIARFHLEALSEDETEHYIRHRLTVAGMTAALPFDKAAMQRIHRLARGVPRRINLLCDRALLGAYAEGEARVTPAIVEKAAGEVFATPEAAEVGSRSGASRWALVGVGLVAGAALFGIGSLVLRPAAQSKLAAAEARPASAASVASAASAASQASAASAVAAASASTVAAAASTAASASSASSAAAAVAASSNGSGDAANDAAGSASAPIAAASAAETVDSNVDGAIRSEDDAWRALAATWKLDLDAAAADPCRALQRQQIECFRSNAGLALIRQLDRPGLLKLRGEKNRPVYALLTGLGDRSATLQIGSTTQTVSLVSLSHQWTGDFATFWRAPQGYAQSLGEGSSGPAVDALVAQLARLDHAAEPTGKQSFGPALKTRLNAFQLAQGLKPDGVAGPTTFMQLNRATGVDEPHLQTGK